MEKVTKDNYVQALITSFGEFAWTVLTFVILAMTSGYVLHTMWGWFIEPAFGTPAPSIAICIGLILTLRWLTRTTSHTRFLVDAYDEKKRPVFIEQIKHSGMLLGLGVHGFVLFLGWVTKSYV